MTAVVHRILLYPLTVPLRHAAHLSPKFAAPATPIVIAIELPRGILGYGEVSTPLAGKGQTVDCVVSKLRRDLTDPLLGFRAESFPDALEQVEALPWFNSKTEPLASVRAAVELALLDAAMRFFQRHTDEIVQWMGLPGFGAPGSLRNVRYAHMLSVQNAPSPLRLRWLTLRGRRQFKLSIGDDQDRQLVDRVVSTMRGVLRSGRAELIVDAEGGWSKDEAIEWLTDHQQLPIHALEQPLPRGSEDQLPVLKDLFDMPLIHDESLVLEEDARRLIDLGMTDGFNVGISKCGGLLPALRLAAMARRVGADVHLADEFGGVGILASAGLRFLEACPAVAWVDGPQGDARSTPHITMKRLSIRRGDRPPWPRGSGLTADVNVDRLKRYCAAKPISINL